jgi:transcriptional regulator with XRE-family HTH domain/Zn-dependent peptidase ImmA (M78 family)
MIKNERQYRITKAQATRFETALVQFMRESTVKSADAEAHPLLRKAQEDALKSQLDELREQLEEYEALRSGDRTVLEVNSFDELPRALIQARIASGMSQRDLGERLGLKEQQIQNYEATEYASASLERITKVVHALGITVRKDIFLPNTDVSLSALFRRLQEIGLDSKFIVRRLLPRSLVARLESQSAEEGSRNSSLVLQAASHIARIFGWSPVSIFEPQNVLDLNMAAVGAARFKLPARSNERRLSAYTVYAHILALLVLDATAHLPRKRVPIEANELHDAVISTYGSLTFEHTLRYVWSLGVPVLPLKDAGAFHGACWRVEGRNIIVLKQQTNSTARWLFDLIHEIWHVGQEPEKDELTVIEESESAQERQDSEDEEAASQFAGDVVLDGRAEELVGMCVKEAKGDIKFFKKILPLIASREQVSTASLANYMAFRLSLQGENWWATATKLQDNENAPWQTARNVLLEHVDFSPLNEFDLILLQQALFEESLVEV